MQLKRGWAAEYGPRFDSNSCGPRNRDSHLCIRPARIKKRLISSETISWPTAVVGIMIRARIFLGIRFLWSFERDCVAFHAQTFCSANAAQFKVVIFISQFFELFLGFVTFGHSEVALYVLRGAISRCN